MNTNEILSQTSVSEKAEFLIQEMKRLRELTGYNLESFSKTFSVLAEPAFEALLTCRNHWKAAFEDERKTAIRLRRAVYDLHNSDDPARKPCQCYDCNLQRVYPRTQ